MTRSTLTALAATPLLLMGVTACGSDNSPGGGDQATGSGKLVKELDCSKIQSLDARPVLGTATPGASGDECEVKGPDLGDEAPDSLTVELIQAPPTLEEFLSIAAENNPDDADAYKVDVEPVANRPKYLIFQKDHWSDKDCWDEPDSYKCDPKREALADVSIDSISGIIYGTYDGDDDDARRGADGFTVKASGWTYSIATAADSLGNGLNFYFVQEDGSALRCTYDFSAKGHDKGLYSSPQDDGLLYWEQSKQAEALEWCNQALAASRD